MSLTKESFFFLLKQKYPTGINEYKFVPGRQFRADFFIPHLNCLVEYEGIMSSKARHTNIKGYTKDCEKYNLASILGFRLLRYTALNSKDVFTDLENMEKNK